MRRALFRSPVEVAARCTTREVQSHEPSEDSRRPTSPSRLRSPNGRANEVFSIARRRRILAFASPDRAWIYRLPSHASRCSARARSGITGRHSSSEQVPPRAT
jgi:hypothetical protein